MALAFTPGASYAAAWGDMGLGVYPTDSHIIAPNGLVYDPFMRLQISINVGRRDLYIFAVNSFFTEKPTPGVTTNSNQGKFDFTKREYDLQFGAAARPFTFAENLEFRIWSLSLANLNRGTDPNRPTGFKDGFAAETRYYLDTERLDGYVAAGYYFSKQLVEPDGDPYKPGVVIDSELNYEFLPLPRKAYAFIDFLMINFNSHMGMGVAWRPFYVSSPGTELRLSYGQYVNFKEKSTQQSTLLAEIKYYF